MITAFVLVLIALAMTVAHAAVTLGRFLETGADPEPLGVVQALVLVACVVMLGVAASEIWEFIRASQKMAEML